MSWSKMINYLLLLLIILVTGFNVFILLFPGYFKQNLPIPSPAGQVENPISSSEPATFNSIPLTPPNNLAEMFYQNLESIVEPSEEPEELPFSARYNTSRLSFLGFTTTEGRKTFLLKDTLFEDVFGISIEETVHGFTIFEHDESTNSLSLKNGEDYFKVYMR